MEKLVKQLHHQVEAILRKMKQSLDNQSRLMVAIDASKRDRDKRKNLELKEELKREMNRGQTLLDKAKQLNFLFVYGCRPSTGVKANTTMVKDIFKAFIENADRINFTVFIPKSLNFLQGNDVTFETV